MKQVNKISGIIGFLILWQFLSASMKNVAFPNIQTITKEFIEIITSKEIISNVASSMKIVLLGIMVAIVFGITMAILMSYFEKLKIALMPLIESLRGVAALTLFPLLIVTMGLGDSSRIFVIFWTAWPSVLLSTMMGLQTDEALIEAGRDLGARKWQEYIYIRIPLALPKIVNGIRIGISGGFISLIAAEMLGATKGIGYMLQWSSQAFNFPAVYAYIIIIALMSGVVNYSMLIVEKNISKKY